MFGVSFSEVIVIAAVALIVVGPKKLPEMLNRLGQWIARLRKMTVDMRRQTGIDEILRSEGFGGGINELRSLIRGEINTVQNYAAGIGTAGAGTGATARAPVGSSPVDPYGDAVEYDRLREHPVEGVDAYGAIPEDLLAAAAPEPPAVAPVAAAATAPVAAPAVNDTPAQPGESKDPA